MLHNVLIVSPHFPPVNAPDHQRIRMSLPYFTEFGWRPTVLTVRPSDVTGNQDAELLRTVPDEIPVIHVKAISANGTRRVGFGDLGFRAFPYLRAAGDRALKSGAFDLVYFSTTVFVAMSLGPRWRKLWNVPYVLDFQDPWLSEYFKNNNQTPPGGRLKYGLSQRVAAVLEPYTLKSASQIISVSPAYPVSFMTRYEWLHEDQFTVLPFGASESDFQHVRTLNICQREFDPRDGKRHWVYVGRGGSDMAFAIRSLFDAISRKRRAEPGVWEDLRLHFIGTDYASDDRAVKTIEPIASEYGLADLVQEKTQRIPYMEGLRCLLDADALIVPGSDDPGYTPSKIYPYILAKKPLLAILHNESSAAAIIEKTTAGTVVTFSADSSVASVATEIESRWLNAPDLSTPDIDFDAFAPYSAREMTRKQCEIFDRTLNGSSTH